MSKIFTKYRAMKDKIDTDKGKIVEKVFGIILLVTLFLFIPITFTLLSTLVGLGKLPLIAYQVIFYLTWSILLISFIVWTFFREYKNK